MGQAVGVEVVDSLLGLEGRARPTPTLALGPTPTLVGRPQTSVASLAPGSLIASLTGDSESGCFLSCHHLQTWLMVDAFLLFLQTVSRNPRTLCRSLHE